MADHIRYRFQVSHGLRRFLTPGQHRRVAREATSATVKDLQQFGVRRLQSRTAGRVTKRFGAPPLWKTLKRARRRGNDTATDLVIYRGPARRSGRSTSYHGSYWRFLFGTVDRVNYRGAARGGFPPPGNPTGRIPRGRYAFLKRPNRKVFTRWYGDNAQLLLDGKPLRRAR